jgi:Cu/Ag efflux protein CusF
MIRLPKCVRVLLGLALFLGLAAPALAANDTKGTLKSIDHKKLTFVMTDKNGRDWTFHMGDGIQVRLNDKASAFDKLKEGDKIYVKYAKDGEKLVASEVDATESAEATNTRGTIKSIDVNKNEFVLSDKNGKDWTFRMADDAKVQTSTNKTAKLEDLKVGDKVMVDYTKKGNDFWANKVHPDTGTAAKEGERREK